MMTQDDYRIRLQKALDFIEDHLEEDIDLDDIAGSACFSKFHFHRLFQAWLGITVADYVRKRRLTMAACRLRQFPDSVLDVALRYCFGTHESFIRAFRRQHGMNPGNYRKSHDKMNSYPRVVLHPTQTIFYYGGIDMEPVIIQQPELTIVGLEILTTLKDNDEDHTIPKLWEKFCPRMSEIKNKKNDDESYGICFGDSPSQPFTYVAGIEVEKNETVPEGMVCRILPASRYAVFTHKGPLTNLKETYGHIYGTWFPQSGLELAGMFDFEKYDSRFKGMYDPNTEIDIYVPIK